MTRILLSVFVIFHLFAIFVLPNPENILYRTSAPLITEYGNLLGINTTWRFFSPNPLIRYMEYTVYNHDAEKNLVGEVHRFPRHFSEEPFFENFSRKLNNAMLMMNQVTFLREKFSKIMCGWHPGAETIAVASRGRIVPNIEKSQLFEGGRESLGEVRSSPVAEFDCRTPAVEFDGPEEKLIDEAGEP